VTKDAEAAPLMDREEGDGEDQGGRKKKEKLSWI
jgi:hypothetical protein